MTFAQLDRAASAIQKMLSDTCRSNSSDFKCDQLLIPVYGGKSPLLLACFLACMRNGYGYVPLDISLPDDRIVAILDQLEPEAILVTEAREAFDTQPAIHVPMELLALSDTQAGDDTTFSSSAECINGEDTQYVIFTSGSTGAPKGVEVSASDVDNFMDWVSTFPIEGDQQIVLNQAPFSFDLSGYELYGMLPQGWTMFALSKHIQESIVELVDVLKRSGLTIWVSTPSFANLCLSTTTFDAKTLSNLQYFIFCGEPLKADTILKLSERFPKAQIFNTYGPTESTVAVTRALMDPERIKAGAPIPCGFPKDGTVIHICHPNSNDDVPSGSQGEIVIEGNTVAKGYYKQPEQTAKCFYGTAPFRAYRTGDIGYLDDSGMLFCVGRLDNQVKVNGYRMELEDIEENLCKTSLIEAACVVPVYKNGSISHLEAHVVPELTVKNTFDLNEGKDRLRFTQAVKDELSSFIPTYMIPRKIIAHAALPMTPNGKINRKKLNEELCR